MAGKKRILKHSEAAETQVWILFAAKCGYLDREPGKQVYLEREAIIAQLVTMSHNSEDWIIR